FALGARFCRGFLGDCLLGGRLFLRGPRRLGLAACWRGLDHLLAPGARSDGRLVVVGQDLGDAQHRDLVAITALAARILAAALLERDDLRATLVLQHLGCHRRAGNRRCTKHRRFSADQQNFAQLHDRTDIAGDLANLEHIIRNDAVLPAAGSDDCEHRFIPSCSIPASESSGPAFSTVVMGSISARFGPTPCAKINRREKPPAPGWRTYSPWRPRVKEKRPKMAQIPANLPSLALLVGPVAAPPV